MECDTSPCSEFTQLHNNDGPLVNNPAPLIEATNSQNIAGQGGERPRAWTTNARMTPGCQSFKAIMEEQESESTCSLLSKKKTAQKDEADKMEKKLAQKPQIPKSPQMPPFGTSTTSLSWNEKTPKQAETGSAKGDFVRPPEQEQSLIIKGEERPPAWTTNARMTPGCQSFKAIMEKQESKSTCSLLSKKKTAQKEEADKMVENKDQGTIVPPLDSPTTSPRERILKYVPGLVIDVLPPFGASLNLEEIDRRNAALAPSREEENVPPFGANLNLEQIDPWNTALAPSQIHRSIFSSMPLDCYSMCPLQRRLEDPQDSIDL